jgi:hypothetical protein
MSVLVGATGGDLVDVTGAMSPRNVLALSHASNPSMGYNTSLPNFEKGGPMPKLRQLRSVSTVFWPRQRSTTSSGVRNFLSVMARSDASEPKPSFFGSFSLPILNVLQDSREQFGLRGRRRSYGLRVVRWAYATGLALRQTIADVTILQASARHDVLLSVVERRCANNLARRLQRRVLFCKDARECSVSLAHGEATLRTIWSNFQLFERCRSTRKQLSSIGYARRPRTLLLRPALAVEVFP